MITEPWNRFPSIEDGEKKKKKQIKVSDKKSEKVRKEEHLDEIRDFLSLFFLPLIPSSIGILAHEKSCL